MEKRDVVVLIGSLRKAAFSRKTAQVLMELAPPALQMELVEIGDLPLYNQDLDPGPEGNPQNPPETWANFRQRIKKADAILFVTPEYNRSVPAALKNAVDVGSRPPKDNVWTQKPAAVVSVTPGSLGAFGANHHLRQSLMAVNLRVLPQPEIYLAGAGKLFDENGKLLNDQTRELLAKFMTAFAEWIELTGRKV